MRSLSTLVLLLPAVAFAQSPRAPLTVEEAIGIALRRNPATVIAALSTAINRTRVGQAEAGFYPRLFAGVQAFAGSINGGASATLGFPDMVRQAGSGPHQRGTEVRRNIHDLVPWISHAWALTSSIPIYDFGRTHGRVDESVGQTRAAEAQQLTVQEQVIVAVRRAFYNVLAAGALVRVATESVKRLTVYAAQAREMVARHLRNPIEVPRTQAELARAELTLIQAKNSLQVSKELLDNALGETISGRFDLVDDKSDIKMQLSLDGLLAAALDSRPELRELRGQVLASRGRLRAAEGNVYYPTIFGSVGINLRGVGGVENKLNYDAGLVFAWPIFEGFFFRKQEEEARLTLRRLDSVKRDLALRITLEVRTGWATLRNAEESIAAARVGLRHARENLRFAAARFKAGLSQVIELADAEQLFTSAEANLVRARYDYKTALAVLERAVGRRLAVSRG